MANIVDTARLADDAILKADAAVGSATKTAADALKFAEIVACDAAADVVRFATAADVINLAASQILN